MGPSSPRGRAYDEYGHALERRNRKWVRVSSSMQAAEQAPQLVDRMYAIVDPREKTDHPRTLHMAIRRYAARSPGSGDPADTGDFIHNVAHWFVY